MNYNAMTLRELIHYLDLYNTDPMVRRLIQRLDYSDLRVELEEAGMDPGTGTFKDDYNRYTPGEYIEQLRRDRDEAESDLEHTKYKLEEAETELDELKTRSIMDFVQEVWQEKKVASFKVTEAMKEVEQVKEQNAKLKEQIDMWGRMNRVT
jgi:predicted  nucleic acid-binding Zn-ribbon protein